MSISTVEIQGAITKIAAGIAPVGAELNELDGLLGDGDLGVTLVNGFTNLADNADELPDDVGMALFTCAKLMTQASGSSFGTLMATGLMAAGKVMKGRTEMDASELPHMLQVAQQAMIDRGGASLGDKTLLDSIDYVASSLAADESDASRLGVAETAATAALDNFRDQQCKVGRARIFGDKTVGMDDPGMVAVLRLITLMR